MLESLRFGDGCFVKTNVLCFSNFEKLSLISFGRKSFLDVKTIHFMSKMRFMFFTDLPELKSVVFMQQSASNAAYLVLSRLSFTLFSVDLPQLKKIGMEVTKDDTYSLSNLQSIVVDGIIFTRYGRRC